MKQGLSHGSHRGPVPDPPHVKPHPKEQQTVSQEPGPNQHLTTYMGEDKE